MTIRVLLFGPMAQAAGAKQLEVPIDGNAIACSELRKRVVAVCPPLERLLPACRFAVNQQFVTDEHMVQPTDEVALIGMVSGGSSCR